MGYVRPKNDGRGRLGGRVKGTPNKLTKNVREAITPVITAYMSGDGIGDKDCLKTLEKDLADMTPADRAKVMCSLVPYVIPKLTSVEIPNAVPVKTFAEELDELDKE